jgi:hypothetical protein
MAVAAERGIKLVVWTTSSAGTDAGWVWGGWVCATRLGFRRPKPCQRGLRRHHCKRW